MPDRYQSRSSPPISVVIGGATFLGLEVIKSLIQKGSQVIVIDDQEPQGSDDLNFLKTNSDITFFKQPLDQPIDASQSIDYVFHLRFTGITKNSPVDKLVDSLLLAIKLTKQNNAKFLLTSNHIDVLPRLNQAQSTQPSQINDFVVQAREITKENFNQIDARIVNLHHLYGPGMPNLFQAQVANLFSGFANGQILLAKDGSQLASPLFITDAAEAIIHAMFAPSTRSKIFDYQGQTSQTLINFAFLLQRTYQASTSGQQLTIKSYSVKKLAPIVASSVPEQISPDEGFKLTLAWITKNLDQSIAKQASEVIKKKLVVRQKKKKPKPDTKKNPIKLKLSQLKSKRGVVVILLTLLIIFIYPFISSLLLARSIRKAVDKRQFTRVSNLSQIASGQLSQAKFRLKLISPALNLLGGNQSQNLIRLVEVGESLARAVETSSQAAINGSQAIKIVIGQTVDNPFPLFEESNIHLSTAFQEFSIAQSTLDSFDHQSLPFKGLVRSLKSLDQQMPVVRDQIITAQKITSIMPQLLGKQESKTYFVLLQNNAELRATGGFIGSFALIVFDKGKLLDIETHDVYTADGQLRGHVEPPIPIKKYLGEANWYLRDVNWDPHFPTSARQAEWFLDKEMGRQVDGTVAINLYVIESLLDAFGPLNLTDYDETITSSNLFQRAEYHSEVNYFEGSTQKRDFLASLVKALHTKIITSDQQVTEGLLVSLLTNASQSHFQASFRDNQIEAVFSDLGFNGGQLQSSCPTTVKSPDCLADYLSIIESNFGVNKVNYFIGRSISHQVKLASNNTNEILTLTLTNNATSNAWPAGAYKNYLRVYTPSTSTLNSIAIDGTQIATKDITISRKNQKTIFGFYTEVPINSQSTIVVDYDLNQALPKEDLSAYNLVFEKQSGTGPDKLDVSITYPRQFSLIKSAPEGNLLQNQINFVSNTTTDQSFLLELTK